MRKQGSFFAWIANIDLRSRGEEDRLSDSKKGRNKSIERLYKTNALNNTFIVCLILSFFFVVNTNPEGIGVEVEEIVVLSLFALSTAHSEATNELTNDAGACRA